MQNIPNTDWAVQLPEGWIADVSRAFSAVDLFAVGRQHFHEVSANVPTDSFVLRDAAAAKVVTITMSFGNALSVQAGGRQLQHISRRESTTTAGVASTWRRPFCMASVCCFHLVLAADEGPGNFAEANLLVINSNRELPPHDTTVNNASPRSGRGDSPDTNT